MIDPLGLMACAGARWRPTIGDPTVMGWLNVLAYLLAAATAAIAARRASAGRQPRREVAFWVGVAALMLALALNKQLDIQSAVTALGRCAAQEGGWYGRRRAVQALAVAALGLLALGAGAGAALALALRRSLGRLWLTLAGLVALGGFVMIRAVGMHHVDALIGLSIGGWRLNWIAELGGIGLVTLGAARARR